MFYNAKSDWLEVLLPLVRSKHIPPCRRVKVTLVLTPANNIRRDPLNLVQSLKIVEDAVVRAGVVPDDSPAYLESQMPLIDAPQRALNTLGGRLTVLIERVL